MSTFINAPFLIRLSIVDTENSDNVAGRTNMRFELDAFLMVWPSVVSSTLTSSSGASCGTPRITTDNMGAFRDGGCCFIDGEYNVVTCACVPKIS